MRITLRKTFSVMILSLFSLFLLISSRAHPEYFFGGWGGGEPEAKYNLYFILKIMLSTF